MCSCANIEYGNGPSHKHWQCTDFARNASHGKKTSGAVQILLTDRPKRCIKHQTVSFNFLDKARAFRCRHISDKEANASKFGGANHMTIDSLPQLSSKIVVSGTSDRYQCQNNLLMWQAYKRRERIRGGCCQYCIMWFTSIWDGGASVIVEGATRWLLSQPGMSLHRCSAAELKRLGSAFSLSSASRRTWYTPLVHV